MIINCTPHDVAIYNISDCILNSGRLYLREKADMKFPEPLRVYPAAKEPARMHFVQGDPGTVDGILVYRWTPYGITGLPDPKTGTFYIVSKMLAQVYPERKDLIFPGTLVYDADENVVGCIDFSRV